MIAVEAPFAAASSTFASSPFSTLMSCNQVIVSWWYSQLFHSQMWIISSLHWYSRCKFYFCPSNYQPWSQFWSPLSLGRIAWPRQGSTAPPWTSKWSMSWHRSQTWLLGLRISRVKKYWIFAFVGRIPDVSAKHSSCNCCKTSSHHCVDLRPEDENLLI